MARLVTAVARRIAAAGSDGRAAVRAGADSRGAWSAASWRPSSVARRTTSGSTLHTASNWPSARSHPARTAAELGRVADHRPLAARGAPARMATSVRRRGGCGCGEVGEHDRAGRGVDQARPTARGRLGRPDRVWKRRRQVGLVGAGQALVLDGVAEREHRPAAAGRAPGGRAAAGGGRRRRWRRPRPAEGGRALEHEGDGRLERTARVPLGDHPEDPRRRRPRRSGGVRRRAGAGRGNPCRCSHARSTATLTPVRAATAPMVRPASQYSTCCREYLDNL